MDNNFANLDNTFVSFITRRNSGHTFALVVTIVRNELGDSNSNSGQGWERHESNYYPSNYG